MRVFNEDKTQEITEYDLELGYLMPELLVVETKPEQPAVEEQFHYEYKHYPNGGVSRMRIVDIEGSPYVPPQEITEQVLVYKKRTYDDCVDYKVRQKYTLSQELAILRQRDTKPEEFYEYNTYVEKCKAEIKAKYNL